MHHIYILVCIREGKISFLRPRVRLARLLSELTGMKVDISEAMHVATYGVGGNIHQHLDTYGR